LAKIFPRQPRPKQKQTNKNKTKTKTNKANIQKTTKIQKITKKATKKIFKCLGEIKPKKLN